MKYILHALTFFIFTCSTAQVFESKESLYLNNNGFSGWYTGNEYTSIASHGDDVFFVMLDNSRRPYVGRIRSGNVDLQPLDKSNSDYKPVDDGHQEYSIGVDKDGYIHVTGDLHNFPQGNSGHIPVDYEGANILYWKSKLPADVSDFEFMGKNESQTIPGIAWSYGRFVPDRNGVLYYVSRTLARQYYWNRGGRGLGIYRYDEALKSWTALGVKAPISDASYPVVAWENSGQNGNSYQQYKADICFDQNNRMHLTTGMNTQDGSAQVNSIIYAYSDDGGQTFQRADGSLITLPMQVESGDRQADVIDVNVNATYEQPSVTHAWENKPVVHFTASGSHYFKYWDGNSWSSSQNSPAGYRGRILFNDHTEELIFISTGSGSIKARSSIIGNDTYYDAGETLRAFDIVNFRKFNVLHTVSWKASTGRFEVLKHVGVPVDPELDCAGEAGGTATIDDCAVCSGGSTGIIPGITCIDITSLSFVDGEGVPYSQHPVLEDGDLINLNDFEKNEFNVYVETDNSPDSVVFNYELNGEYGTRIEKNKPYALRGDGSAYDLWELSVGEYEVSIMLWFQGELADSRQVVFEVVQPVLDCNGDENGSAEIDQCGVCAGGLTGIEPNDCVTASEMSENSEYYFYVYPNPTDGVVFFNKECNYRLCNAQGKVLKTGKGNSISLGNISNGWYFLVCDEYKLSLQVIK